MNSEQNRLNRLSGRLLRATCVILICALFLLQQSCRKKEAPPPSPPAPSVTIACPLQKKVTDYLDFTGTTQAVKTVQLRARVAGYLEKVLFRDGAFVHKGQTLFVIQRNTYEANLQQAEAAITLQEAQLDYAGREFVRYSDLLKQNAAAQTDVDNWRYQRDSARANLSSARARRELAQLDLSYTNIQAPFDGRIDRTLIDEGNLVGSGEVTPLAQLSQINPIYAYFNISDADLAKIRAAGRWSVTRIESSGRPVFAAMPGETEYRHKGRLDFASVSLNPTTGTLLLRGVFPNQDGRVLPGLYTRIRVPIRERLALLVPSEAVDYEQRGAHIKVVTPDNKVEERYVTVGPTVDDMVVIEKGLALADCVVIRGLQKAIPGRAVRPQKEEMRSEKTTGSPGPNKPQTGGRR